jgi:hypothetical protein
MTAMEGLCNNNKVYMKVMEVLCVTAYFDLSPYLYLSRLIHDASLIIPKLSVPSDCLYCLCIHMRTYANAYWTYLLSRYLAVYYLMHQRALSHSTFLFC